MNNILRYYGAILLVCILVTGCADDFYVFEPIERSAPLVLVINHISDSTSFEISQHVTQTMDYAGIPFVQIDASKIEQVSIPQSVKLVYITTDYVEEFGDEEIERLVRFAATGNEIVVLNPIFDERFSYLLGIKEHADHIINEQAEGIHFYKDVFPYYKGITFKNREPYKHFGFDGSQFVGNKTVIASAATDSTYPVILQRDIGYGRSIFFNTTIIRDKDYRGLLFSVGLKALAGIPYRVANTNTIFLDDFPAPLYSKKMAPIDEEYNLTHENFITQVWWPDMKALADTFNIDYTTVVAFNYNAIVVPPFDFSEWKASIIERNDTYYQGSIWLAQDVRDTRHELGFHGYNHFSLWKKDWPNQAFMEMAIEAAKKRWIIDQLGPMPVTYIPPTNLIDSVGLASISLKMPSVAYMSSLYHGYVPDGGGREFGPDPLAPQLFDYPRITSGYIDDEIANFIQNSSFIYTGIWTHFVHPDDVFQEKGQDEHEFRSRNPLGLGWRSSEKHDYGLYDVFKKRIEETLKRYPLSRFLAARDAAPIVKNWRQGQSSYRVKPDAVIARHQHKELPAKEAEDKFWFMYAPASDRAQVEQALAAIDGNFTSSPLWEGRLYQFSSPADSVAVPNLHKPLIHKQNTIADAVQSYQATLIEEIDHKDENTGNELSNTTSEWKDRRLQNALISLQQDTSSIELEDQAIKMAVAFDSIEIAISFLEKRLITSAQRTLPDMESLSKYYGWNKAPERAFSYADTFWQKDSTETALTFNDLVTSQFGVPDIQYQLRWNRRALQLNPQNEVVLQELIKLNNVDGRWPQQKKYINQLLSLNPQSDSLYAYAIRQSLAHQDNQQTLLWLTDMPNGAEDQLQPLNGEIAYWYADREDYTRAGMWAENSEAVPPQTKLYWLLKQQRYHDFINAGTAYLQADSRNDSLRAYVGQELIYENFRDKGYQFLYPLFKTNSADSTTRKLVHNEISYMSYEQKKTFCKQYPAFFPEKFAKALRIQYRQTEGVEGGTRSSYSFDNFNNNIGRIEAYANWGNEQTHRSQVMVGRIDVRSPTGMPSAGIHQSLHHLKYSFRHNLRQQTAQYNFGVGAYFGGKQTHPTIDTGAWFARDSTFTSAKFAYQPTFTGPALSQNISQIKGELYREDHWMGNLFQTNLSITGQWFTDKNIAFESTINVKPRWSFLEQRGIQPVVDFSYADAYNSQPSGIPYYTADNLITGGVGLELSYKDKNPHLGFSANIELMAKRNNSDGNYWTGSTTIKTKVNNFWELNVQGYLSTSKIYRYNSFNLGISYLLPRKMLL
mgnify:CR=1 FL=1